MSIKLFAVIALLGYSVMAVSGCAGLSKKNKDMGAPEFLEPQAALKFADLPAPAGFKLLAEESYTFESSGIRVGLLKYQGKANIEQVVSFYKDQMPMYNWNLANAVEYGQRLLNFERENESCIVTLLPNGRRTGITIALGPKSQVKPKKSDKPIK